MADELVFYTHPMSRGRIIRWMLEEVGQPYRTEVLDYATTMKAAEYLSINPMGKVPAIRHGDTVVTECAAICAYLADVFPEANLAPPPGDRARGPYYRWLFYGAGPVEAAALNKTLGVAVPDDPRQRGMVGYGSMQAVLGMLEHAVETDAYLTGPNFSAADLYLGAHLAWGMAFGTLEKRPAFERFVGKIINRPAAIRAREIDDDLMRQAGAEPPSFGGAA